jgi:hypothetical protein
MEVFLDLLQVFPLGGIIVGQLWSAASEFAHEAKLPEGLFGMRLTRTLGAQEAGAARRAGGVAFCPMDTEQLAITVPGAVAISVAIAAVAYPGVGDWEVAQPSGGPDAVNSRA